METFSQQRTKAVEEPKRKQKQRNGENKLKVAQGMDYATSYGRMTLVGKREKWTNFLSQPPVIQPQIK